MTEDVIHAELLECEGIDPEVLENLNRSVATLIESLTILNGMVQLATQRMRAFADLSDVQWPEPDFVLERHLKAPATEG